MLGGPPAGRERLRLYAKRIELPALVAVEAPTSSGFGIIGAWPNPAPDRIEVTFALGGESPATLELIDLAGPALRRSALSPGTSRQTVRLAHGDLANGVYFIHITQGARTATARVAVAR